MLTFESDEDINKIYAIDDIMGTRVQVKPLRTQYLNVSDAKHMSIHKDIVEEFLDV